MRHEPSIAVLVSAGRHPVSGTARACKGDLVAMALVQGGRREGVRIVHAGDPADSALPDYLGYGARRISVLPGSPETDALPSVAEAVAGSRLIVTGMRAEQGEGSGMLPYLLAKRLGRPIVANVLSMTETSDGLELVQFLPKGKRRRLHASGPLVVAVHPLAPVTLRYAYANRVSGQIETRALPTEPTEATAHSWTLEPGPRHAQILSAAETRGAHQRMTDAVAPRTKSGRVVSQGSATDKAQVLINYLRDNRLIEL